MVAVTSAITHDDIWQKYVHCRRFQFPVHISAQGTEYSPLLSDSVLGHFLASLRELSPAAQTSDHAAASFSFSLAK